MTILSDGGIIQAIASGAIEIDPYNPQEQIQPASYDVRASGQFRVFRNDGSTHIDPRQEQPTLTVPVEQVGDKPFVLHPGEFVLGSTVEKFRLGHNIVGRLEGKSSLGRLGLVIHSTAGFIDPGFDGTITLELSNAATLPICLWANMPIGQVSFQLLDKPCEVPYGDPRRKSKYQHQDTPTASKMHQNFEHVDGYPDTVKEAIFGVPQLHEAITVGPYMTPEEIAAERAAMGKPNILPPTPRANDHAEHPSYPSLESGRPIAHELRPFTEPPEVCICIDGSTDINCKVHGLA